LEQTKTKLRAQEGELDTTRGEVTRLARKHESQVTLLETTKQAYDQTLQELNDLLVQKESLTSEVC
jgi:hypothetical protein